MESLEQSIYQQLRHIGFKLSSLWSGQELQDLEAAPRKSIEAIRRQVQAAQAVAKDYEMTESQEDNRAQLRLQPKLVQSVDQLRAAILKASEYELIGAVDVAQLSAQLDGIDVPLRQTDAG